MTCVQPEIPSQPTTILKLWLWCHFKLYTRYQEQIIKAIFVYLSPQIKTHLPHYPSTKNNLCSNMSALN